MRVTFETGTQRVMRILGSQIVARMPQIHVVQSQGVFEPKESDLPLVRMAWRQRAQHLLTRMEYPVGVEAIDTDFSYTPKVAGTQEAAAGVLVEDSGADFSHVRVGDVIRNLTQETAGVVEEVLNATTLEADVSFAPGDEYDIHWAKDAEKLYVADRQAVLELDVYAKPYAPYGEGVTLDEIERDLMHHTWTWFREAFQAEYVEVVDFQRVSDQGGIIATGLGSDWYDRGVIELTLVVADGMALRKPTVEAVPIPAVPELTDEKADDGKSGFVEELL